MVEIIAKGPFAEEQVVVETVDTGRRRGDAVERQISRGWREAVHAMDARGRAYFDGPLVRFEGARIERGLCVRVSPSIRYRDVIGSRWIASTSSCLTPIARPNPLSVLVVLTTRDRRLVLGWRTTGDWRPSYEVSGGFVRRGESLFQAARARLAEDYAACATGLDSLSLAALYSCSEIMETIALFVARTRCDAREVQALHRYPRLRLADECARVGLHDVHPPSVTALQLYRSLACPG